MEEKLEEVIKRLDLLESEMYHINDQIWNKLDKVYGAVFPNESTYYIPDYDRVIAGMKREELEQKLGQLQSQIYEPQHILYDSDLVMTN